MNGFKRENETKRETKLKQITTPILKQFLMLVTFAALAALMSIYAALNLHL
jgi:hypothetical protein